jgi:hypothetical protein
MHVLSISLKLSSTLVLATLMLEGCLGHSCSGPSNEKTRPAISPAMQGDQAGKTGTPEAGTPAQTSDGVGVARDLQFPLRMPVSYPPMVVDYVNATIREPATVQHADLGQAWDAVANLSNASPFAGTIGQQVKTTAAGPVPPLIAAWVSADPEEAAAWLIVQLGQGRYPYLAALATQPAAGRVILHQVKLDNPSRQLGNGVCDLLRSWEPLRAEDIPLVKPLAESTEPATRLRAIGYLLALGAASEAQVEELKQALGSAKNSEIAPAAEACRICQDERLASALVTPAALIKLGAEEPADAQHDSIALYTAYALTYLPGGQAKLLRQKLLGAADTQVRWQARLGELLHGDMQPWYDAVLKASDDDRSLWLALQPEGVAHPDLLPTYRKAAASPHDEVRLRVAEQLNRYRGYTSDKAVGEIVGKLIKDKVPAVAAQSWHSAALLHLAGFGAEAQHALDDSKTDPKVRLAAGFYQLKLAEPAPSAPESAQPDKTAGGGGKS